MIAFFDDKNKSFGFKTVGNAKVWTTFPQEKILKDEFSIYENKRFLPIIELTGVKNEYVNAQLTLSATGKIECFDLETCDLKNDSGKIFDKQNIRVFNMLYTTVLKNFHGGRQPIGRYPECLVPFDKAVEWGENCVPKNENQTVWIRFYIPENIAHGKYSGEFILTADGEKLGVPVTVNVADFTLTDKDNTKTLFSLGGEFIKNGENDKNSDMYDAYVDELLEHRISPTFCLNMLKYPYEERLKPYVDRAYELMTQKNMSTLGVPTYPTTINGYKNFCPIELEKYIDAIYYKSIETHYNMMEKAVFYNWMLDEPFMVKYPEEQVKQSCNLFKEVVKKCVEKHLNDDCEDIAFRDEVINSIANFKNLITDYYEERYANDIECWCPKFDGCDKEEDRAKYANQKEKWWYNCNEPNAPYAGYHTEDMLMSARMIDWSAIKYGYKGNLYWLCTFYNNHTPFGTNIFDPSYDFSDRGICNGDALLFYPGILYGLKRPLVTNKLEAIRDGHQDYELLWYLKNTYLENGVDFDPIMDFLSDGLFVGTQVVGDEEKFVFKRNLLVKLAEYCKNYGFIVKKIENSGDKISLEFIIDGNVEINANYKLKEQIKNGGKITVSVIADKDFSMELRRK